MTEVKLQVLNHLQLLFPIVEKEYLIQSIETQLDWTSNTTPTSTSNNALTNRKGKGKVSSKPNQDDSKLVSRLVERIAAKMLELNKGIYPVTCGDSTIDKNLALIHLHQIFPKTSIQVIKNVLLSLSHSFLYIAVDQLLTSPTHLKSTAATSTTTTFFSLLFKSKPSSSSPSSSSQSIPTLLPSDLWRSPSYQESLIHHLKVQFPLVPSFTIRAIVLDMEGASYREVREEVEKKSKSGRLRKWLIDVFSGSGITSSENKEEERIGRESELGREIFEYEAPQREFQRQQDEKLARRLNQEWSEKSKESVYSCGCCFDEALNFVDVGFCSSGAHSFCKECVKQQVEEIVFGDSPLQILVEEGSTGEGTGVRCLSTEACSSPFSHSELERILPSTLFSALHRRLSEAQLEALELDQLAGGSHENLVRCPFCLYSEIGDSSVLSKAFPFVNSILSRKGAKMKSTMTLEGLFLWPWVDIISSINFIHLYTLTFIAIHLFPTSFSHLAYTSSSSSTSTTSTNNNHDDATLYPLLEPNRVFLISHRYLTSIGTKLLNSEGGRNVFQCKNGPDHSPLPRRFGEALEEGVEVKDHYDLIKKVWPGWNGSKKEIALTSSGRIGTEEPEVCGRLSCRNCERVYVGDQHVCHQDERDGLRLAVEKAIDLATKRYCPVCKVSFLKEAGCNKITCRCGYISCWNCRKDIRTESYQHFCNHFRAVLGANCSECEKCNLWQEVNDTAAIDIATKRAREAYVREHPETSRASINQKIGHNVSENWLLIYFHSYVEFCLRPVLL